MNNAVMAIIALSIMPTAIFNGNDELVQETNPQSTFNIEDIQYGYSDYFILDEGALMILSEYSYDINGGALRSANTRMITGITMSGNSLGESNQWFAWRQGDKVTMNFVVEPARATVRTGIRNANGSVVWASTMRGSSLTVPTTDSWQHVIQNLSLGTVRVSGGFTAP